jgi:shikimate kinase
MLIFLIGFMGCGKSYIGRNLAPLMDYEHIDMDQSIEAQEGLSVSEIFSQKGEEYFREREKAFIRDLDPAKNIIISTGGGAPCFFDNMEVMNQKGLTIYLNRNKESVIKRLMRRPEKRPLLKGMDEAALSAFYDERLAARKPNYEKAQLFAGDLDYADLYKKIVEEFNP